MYNNTKKERTVQSTVLSFYSFVTVPLYCTEHSSTVFSLSVTFSFAAALIHRICPF